MLLTYAIVILVLSLAMINLNAKVLKMNGRH
jgi:hypothetical protein